MKLQAIALFCVGVVSSCAPLEPSDPNYEVRVAARHAAAIAAEVAIESWMQEKFGNVSATK